ncbi:DUF2214 domain-containing protein [Thalassobaculum sp. OXR-137]|uniref:DUF2214 domain-containing protein n=1 Tax=Thalassobaculum sp. OXR-137 TaxID=3100173 RepID=UPI002AC980C6|nr:DUF2214 domain-containing protein [Thalassobaculum sp. OXR-137]WPZ36331.1 DUF2214 domain-containing protein [Thalassobaculum sp. OXR-137]
MDGLLSALAASEAATALRFSRWSYAAANTAHVLGVAVLVGGILPLDLRLLGLWPRVEAGGLVRVLVPMAAAGLGLAVISGFLLFVVRPLDYAGNTAFLTKIGLISVGAASALSAHAVWGRWLERAGGSVRARVGAVSMLCWIGALIAGRMIAFTGD